MRREEFLEGASEQEEAGSQKGPHVRSVFAEPDGAVGGGRIRGVRRRFPCGFGHPFG
jgi:hypothetical protein